MERFLKIIERAVRDFGMSVDMADTFGDVLTNASNLIEEEIDYDYIAICERNEHYNHIAWNDGKFEYEADGDFISFDAGANRYFRRVDGEWVEVAWYEQDYDDYVLMDRVLDSEGKRVALVCN